MNRLRLILPLVAALAGAAACTESPAKVAAPAVTASAVSPSAVASTSAGPIVLSFTAKTMTGAEFAGTGLAGKPAVLWFWSPSSAMCDEQAVGVRRAATGFAGMANVVGIAVEGDAAAQSQFIDKFPHLPDADGALAKQFSITGPGTFVMIDRDGEINEIGTFNSDRLLKRVDLADDELTGARPSSPQRGQLHKVASCKGYIQTRTRAPGGFPGPTPSSMFYKELIGGPSTAGSRGRR